MAVAICEEAKSGAFETGTCTLLAGEGSFLLGRAWDQMKICACKLYEVNHAMESVSRFFFIEKQECT